MKAFVISLIVIFSILSLTILNSVYTSNVISSLIDDAKSLNLEDNSVYEYTKKWEKKQPIIKISSSHKETHKIDEILKVLESKSHNNVYNGFEEDKMLLIEYLMQIKEDETVSFDSII